MSSDREGMKPDTEVVHLGRDPAKHLGAVNTPVYRASTMVFPTLTLFPGYGSRSCSGRPRSSYSHWSSAAPGR